MHEGALRLTQEGIFISDSIISDLLWVIKKLNDQPMNRIRSKEVITANEGTGLTNSLPRLL